MSLWAWLSYSYTYSFAVIKAPFSLNFWQQTYNLNSLLVVQEMADTFGLLTVAVLLISAQLLARNYMFSIFTLRSNQWSYPNNTDSKFKSYSNTIKPLTTINSTLSYLLKVLKSKFTILKSTLK